MDKLSKLRREFLNENYFFKKNLLAKEKAQIITPLNRLTSHNS